MMSVSMPEAISLGSKDPRLEVISTAIY